MAIHPIFVGIFSIWTKLAEGWTDRQADSIAIHPAKPLRQYSDQIRHCSESLRGGVVWGMGGVGVFICDEHNFY